MLEKETKQREQIRLAEQNEAEKAKIEEEVKEKETQKGIKIEEIEDKLLSARNKLRGLERQLDIADTRIKKETSGFWGFFKNYLEVRANVLSDYPDLDKIPLYKEEITLLSSRLERLNNPIIVKCENKNDKLFNIIGLEDLTFVGVHNSHDVFIAAKSNPNHFCIRDH